VTRRAPGYGWVSTRIVRVHHVGVATTALADNVAPDQTTLFLQQVLGYPPLVTGAANLLGAACSVVVAGTVAARVVGRVGVAWTILAEGIDIVVEGEATRVRADAELREVADAYESKYGVHVTGPAGTWFGLGDAIRAGDTALYRVAPVTAFGFGKGKQFRQTRWCFR
jgi:hypothetical protein